MEKKQKKQALIIQHDLFGEMLRSGMITEKEYKDKCRINRMLYRILK